MIKIIKNFKKLIDEQGERIFTGLMITISFIAFVIITDPIVEFIKTKLEEFIVAIIA